MNYESDSDQDEPIEISNCDFSELNEEDQAIVSNLYETHDADQTKTSDEEARDAPEENYSSDPSVTIAASHSPAKRTKYALEENQLSPSMSALLRQVREFFIKPNSLERARAAVTPSTIDKANERIRCK